MFLPPPQPVSITNAKTVKNNLPNRNFFLQREIPFPSLHGERYCRGMLRSCGRAGDRHRVRARRCATRHVGWGIASTGDLEHCAGG